MSNWDCKLQSLWIPICLPFLSTAVFFYMLRLKQIHLSSCLCLDTSTWKKQFNFYVPEFSQEMKCWHCIISIHIMSIKHLPCFKHFQVTTTVFIISNGREWMSRQDIFWQTFPKVLDHDDQSHKMSSSVADTCMFVTHGIHCQTMEVFISDGWEFRMHFFCHHYFGYQVMTRSYPSCSKDTFLNQSQEFRDESSIIVEMRGKQCFMYVYCRYGWHCYSETKVTTVVSMWTGICIKWMSCWPGFFLTLRMRKNKPSPS